MDYKDFTKREDAYNKFVKLRKIVLDSEHNGAFAEVFTDLCATALGGDCVAQDVVAYFFSRGVPSLLPLNYEYYMSWEILAGANGNEFALEKLEFFLNPSLEPIINDEKILFEALKRKNVNKQNAIMVISNLICEGIVDRLKLDPKDLINIPEKPKPYSPEITRKFYTAMDDSLEDVALYLIS